MFMFTYASILTRSRSPLVSYLVHFSSCIFFVSWCVRVHPMGLGAPLSTSVKLSPRAPILLSAEKSLAYSVSETYP